MQKRYLTLVVIAALLLPSMLMVATSNNVSATNVGTSQSWLQGTIGENARSCVSTAVDANGYTHVSYFSSSNKLMYATNAGGEWTTTTVDSSNGAGYYNSIAVDSDGHAYIVYYDSTTTDLKYATNAGGSWSYSTIVSSADAVGTYCSIAISDSDAISIAYCSSNYSLTYGSLTGSTWSFSTVVSVSTGGIIDSCLSFGPNSVPFVTYLDQSTNKLMFARLAAGTWVIGMVDSSAVTPISSSDVDQYGYLYVVYREYGSTNLKVARQVSTNSTSWAYSYPDNSSGVASAISIRADSYGYLHLAFYDMTNNQLVYATNNEGPWSHRVLSIAGSVDSKVSLCLDEYNKVHLAYIDGSNYDLKYFTDASAIWTSSAISNATTGAGDQSVVLVDSKGVTHVAFYDKANGRLLYANDSTGSWVISIVDSGNVGKSPAMAFDSRGNVHISYYDVADSKIKYATNAGMSSGWYTTLFDASSKTGSCSAIAVNSTGSVCIVYRDDQAENLKYAICTKGSWNINGLVYSNQVGEGLSMVADASGIMHLAYIDDSIVKYTTLSGTTWSTPSVVDSTRQCNGTLSLALNSAGDLALIYLESSSTQTRQTLWYSTFASSAWSSPVSITSALASTEKIKASLVLDANGLPTIFYRNADMSQGVMSMKMSSGIWMNSTVDTVAVNGTVTASIDPNGRIHLCYYNSAESLMTMTVNIVTPSVPRNLNATSGDSFVRIGWEAPTFDGGDSVTGYLIFRGTSLDSMTLFLAKDSSTLYYNDTSVTNGQTYYYKVEAVNSEGASVQTAAVSATPVGQPVKNSDNTLLIVVLVLAAAVIVAVAAMLIFRNRGPKPPKSKFQQPQRRKK